MDLIGKFLVTWMPLKDALFEILSVTGEDRDDLTMVGAEIVGETDRLGLWVQLTTIMTRDDKTEYLLAIPDRPDQLIRWDLLRNASLFRTQPTTEQAFGFRRR